MIIFRYLVNDACVLAGKPLVSGSALRFEGQVHCYFLTYTNISIVDLTNVSLIFEHGSCSIDDILIFVPFFSLQCIITEMDRVIDVFMQDPRLLKLLLIVLMEVSLALVDSIYC